jgi:hypothetical protein
LFNVNELFCGLRLLLNEIEGSGNTPLQFATVPQDVFVSPLYYQLPVGLQPTFQLGFELPKINLNNTSAAEVWHGVDMSVQLFQASEFLLDCFDSWVALEEGCGVHVQVLFVRN